MSFFGRLFSSPKSIEKAVDGVYNGIDKAFYTDEEKAEYRAKAQGIYQKMWLAAVPSAVNRRIVAAAITAMWMLCIMIALAANAWGASEYADYALTMLQDVVNPPFMIVVGFYFLKAVATSVVSRDG